jgi:N-acetylglucosaminyldiphosphoundecaprenol N-acetyl-beta-D-mannosaminyltransferase
LWIGLSTPKQEKFATRVARHTRVHCIVTVGAAFDFHIGKIKEAPKIMRQMGVEWFFRLCSEPKRLYKRYSEVVPLYIYYNFIEFLKFNKH